MGKHMLLKAFFLAIAIISAISLFSVRNSAIEPFDWKKTSGGENCPDFLFFEEGTNYRYNFPLIKNNKEVIGFAIFQYGGRLIIFSFKDKSIALFMII